MESTKKPPINPNYSEVSPKNLQIGQLYRIEYLCPEDMHDTNTAPYKFVYLGTYDDDTDMDSDVELNMASDAESDAE
jgi:hypothetical protein